MKKKAFDCVEMKRQGAALVQAQLAGKNRAEELAFWEQQSTLLKQRRQKASQRAATPTLTTPEALFGEMNQE